MSFDSTQLIPEAIPKPPISSRSSDSARRGDVSPSRLQARSAIVRTGFSSSANPAKVYPDDREGTSLVDAAGFWVGSSVSGFGVDGPPLFRAEESRMEAASSSPQKLSNDEDDPLLATNRRVGEDGPVPSFDMDVPVAYGSVAAGNLASLHHPIGVDKMTSGTVVTSTGARVVTSTGGRLGEEGEKIEVTVRDTTAMMENIETERVPCPRLCGATFGPGSSGLIVFHNGDVKKMWYWYQRTDAVRLSGAPGVKGDAAFSDTETIGGKDGFMVNLLPSPQVEGSMQSQPSSGPRTLKDLMNMTATAKEVRSFN